MSLLLRKFRRAKKKAAKFRFNISCKELMFDCAPKWRPEKIVIACLHRRRRHEITPRRPDWSFDQPTRAMVAWPEDGLDPLLLTTTLFRDRDQDQYEDKDWTLVVEEVTSKGKHRPLAAISINMRLFITELPGTRMEAKFKLRPLRKEVNLCTLQLDISSKLLREGEVAEEDLQSLASGISTPQPETATIAADSQPAEQKKEVIDEIARVSDEIKTFVDAAAAIEESRPLIPSPDAKEATKKIEDVPPIEQPKAKAEERRPEPTEEEEGGEEEVGRNVPDFATSTPVQVNYRKTNPKIIPQSPILPAPPAVIPDEPLIEWCSRVTRGYKHTTVRDFTKSFKTGLAFCAIIHRYRPELIGNFEDLDFSETLGSYKSNCKKAFEAAERLGIRSTLDESVVTLPDRAQIQKFLDMLRFVLEGGSISNGSAEQNRQSTVNHRISSIYGLSEGEVTILSDFEFMKQSRLQEDSETDSAVLEGNFKVFPSPAPARNVQDPSVELHEIALRLKHIEKLDAEIMSRLANAAAGSADETRLVDEKLKLLDEKNELILRQDDINQKLSY